MKLEKFQLNDELSLATIVNEIEVTENKRPPSVNHVFCCDVSYSMCGELDDLKKHLKDRIADIVDANDTITIIWFSSRNQCGFVKELASVATPQALTALHKAIDQFIRPVGCTSFLDPIELTQDLIKRNEGLYSFIFMTDGYNNDSPFKDVIERLGELSESIAASTFIEYGYYADSRSLAEMAATTGGSHILSKDFENYQHDFEAAITNRPKSMLTTLDISAVKDSMRYQYLWYVDEGQVRIISTARKTEVFVPKHIEKFYTLTKAGKDQSSMSLEYPDIAYAIYVMATQMRYDTVESLLSVLCDRQLVEAYNVAYGKSKLEEFKQLVLDIANGTVKQYSKGIIDETTFDKNANQYCLIDLLDDLVADNAHLVMDEKYFAYNRTTAKSVTKTILSEEDKLKLIDVDTAKKAQEVIDNVERVEFVRDLTQPIPIRQLVFNEDRANISIRVTINGLAKLPQNKFDIKEVSTFIFRNYTILKDGIINMPILPVKISDELFAKLDANEFVTMVKADDGIAILDLSKIALTNKKRTSTVVAKKLATQKVELLRSQIVRKACDNFLKSRPYTASMKNAPTYSTEAEDYIKSLGIDKYKGYSPKTETIKSDDFYMADRLRASIKSFSSIPTTKKVFEKRANGKKMTPAEDAFNDAIIMVDALNLDTVETLRAKADRVCQDLLQSISTTKLSLILSRKPFSGLDSVDGVKTTVEVEGSEYEVTFKQDMEKVPL